MAEAMKPTGLTEATTAAWAGSASEAATLRPASIEKARVFLCNIMIQSIVIS
jgi:hypothetical protein